ncbi:MAG TPA: helix-turn-helix transcriptional regulator [Leadbetterella sp.]|nr:helix-turn-helix transcriptional regulator [Leadbetterella sp.]
MNNTKTNVEKFLDLVSKESDGKLLKELKWRQANRAWLRKSQSIAIKILSTLKTQGISQKELAEKMGVSPQMVNKILKGSENLTLETISKIEIALGIHLIETAETLKAKISEYEEIIFGITKTLKTIVQIFEPKKETSGVQIEKSKFINAISQINTNTCTTGESNLKVEETNYAMAA